MLVTHNSSYNHDTHPVSLSDQLTRAAADSQQHISTHEIILNDLEELGDMMTQMLERQHVVEVRSTALTPLIPPRRPFRPRAAFLRGFDTPVAIGEF